MVIIGEAFDAGVTFVVSTLLLVGICKKKPWYFIPWLVVFGLNILLTTVIPYVTLSSIPILIAMLASVVWLTVMGHFWYTVLLVFKMTRKEVEQASTSGVRFQEI